VKHLRVLQLATAAAGAAFTGWLLSPHVRAWIASPTEPKHDAMTDFPMLRPLTPSEKASAFGAPSWTPIPGTPPDQAVALDPAWSANLVTVVTPLLVPIGTKRVTLHKKVVDPFLALLQAWKDEGVLDDVLSFDGAFNPRLVRGGNTLSNHALGTAFDVNARWNPLGTQGAAPGEKGSVDRLIPIAARLGWFNGRYYKTRPDPMHFEFVTSD
jgi:hypothetical protein